MHVFSLLDEFERTPNRSSTPDAPDRAERPVSLEVDEDVSERSSGHARHRPLRRDRGQLSSGSESGSTMDGVSGSSPGRSNSRVTRAKRLMMSAV